jgi:hypothetical protein
MDTKKWMTGMRAGLLLLLGIGLSACAGGGTSATAASTPYPPPGYAHTVKSAHVQLFWNCTRPEAGVMQVAGVAVNPWSVQPIRFLEFTLVGVDANERSVSSAKGEAKNFLLRTWESTPFQLDLRTAGGEVRYDLYYQYQFQDKDHDRIIGKVAWDGSPEPASGPLLLAQTVGFMARDACSDSQHRTP